MPTAPTTPARAAPAITSDERYLFDLQGYLLVPEVLDAQELTALNALVDSQIASQVDPQATQHRFMEPSLLHWGRPLLDLIDHPRLRPYLDAFIGEQVRLDHDYADIIRRGLSPIGASLHGGGSPHDWICSYQVKDGAIRSGLLAVAFNLHDVEPGWGGFACIPGSHKANYPLPAAWAPLAAPAGCVQAVPGKAGSMVIFTEALTHGTLPWQGEHERRTVFLKFSPAGMSWHAGVYHADDFGVLTDRQRDLLESPNARYGGRRTGRR